MSCTSTENQLLLTNKTAVKKCGYPRQSQDNVASIKQGVFWLSSSRGAVGLHYDLVHLHIYKQSCLTHAYLLKAN